MPIQLKSGNLLDSKCDILVNTVNCVGVMGAGIAKSFKDKYPRMFKQYKLDCEQGRYKPSTLIEYNETDGKIILNFATKDHWMESSNIRWIVAGLDNLNKYLNGTTYSIAIPALGCNNGGLDWNVVKELIYSKLDNLNNEIELYMPI